MLEGKRVLIGIGGGIAAYKICEVISTLFKHGAQVRVILTNSAAEFVTPLTISTLCRHPAYSDRYFWKPIHTRPLHIELGEWAELLVIAPLTANTLGKLANGLADNLLTNTVLASRCPILLAPAMNTEMWEQAAARRNWNNLFEDKRYHSIGPETGQLACDRFGPGRMAEPEAFLPAIQSILLTHGRRDLTGKHILISAGGTREYLDPVRFIGNPSTGKMGIAVAQAAFFRGAKVTLVCAPTVEPEDSLVSSISIFSITSAAEMRQAMLDCFPCADWTVMAAAVGDFKPATYTPRKLPKRDIPSMLELEPIPDILAELGQQKQPHQRLIGFAAQTGNIINPALEKLEQKKLDAIAANPIDLPNAGFGSNTNEAIFFDCHGRKQEMSSRSKLELAHLLLDFVRGIAV